MDMLFSKSAGHQIQHEFSTMICRIDLPLFHDPLAHLRRDLVEANPMADPSIF
jgi:hypothetical protein